MSDLMPVIVTFFVIAGIAVTLAVAALVQVGAEQRSRRRPTVVAMTSSHPGTAAVARRAA